MAFRSGEQRRLGSCCILQAYAVLQLRDRGVKGLELQTFWHICERDQKQDAMAVL